MKTLKIANLVWLLLAFQTAMTRSTQAQVVSSTTEVQSLIAPDAVAMLSIQPAAIVRCEAFRRFPWEVMSAAGIKYLGIDPMLLERIDVLSGIPVPGPAGWPLSVCLTHSQPVTPELLKQYLPNGSVKEKGVELWPVPQLADFALAIRGTHQVILGPKLQVIRLMRSPLPDGELRQAVAAQGHGAAAQLVVALEPLRDLLISLAEWPILQSDAELNANLTVLAQKARLLAVRFDAGERPSTTCILEANSAADIQDLAQASRNLIRLGAASVINTLEAEVPNHPGETPKATLAYAKRLTKELESTLNFQPRGNRLSVTIEGVPILLAHTGITAGLLLPMIETSRAAVNRMARSNNMRYIMFAFHEYISVHDVLPSDSVGPTNSVGSKQSSIELKNTPANLSWRVHLLPFISEQKLYQEFRFDQPWDSPHNLQLLPRMPALYRDPFSRAAEGYTIYQMPRGKDMVNNPAHRIRISDITDGTANTIVLMASVDQAAVPWTQPTDFDPIEQPTAISRISSAITVATADGSVYDLDASVPLDVLKKLLLINDGQAIDPEQYQRR